MILFREDGHLTDEALCAAVEQVLDEMSRLEVAEHLSFCDGCLERYTALLTDDTLLTPARPIAPPVLSRLRKRAVAVMFNRYTTYGAAACLALMLWGAGVFTGLGSGEQLWQHTRQEAAAQAAAAPSFSFAMQANDFLDGLAQGMRDVLDDAIPTYKPQPREAKTAPNVADAKP